MKKGLSIIILMASSVLVLSGCGFSTKTPSTDGGMFVSFNAGETWEAKNIISKTESGTISISSHNMSSLVFSPTDPLTLYFLSGNSGIFTTINGGDQWQNSPLGGVYSALVVDPSNPDILYAAQGVSIFKTVDGMNTWSTIYVETRPKQSITSIAVDSYDPSRIYASTQNFLIKSEDFGTTWRSLDWEGTLASDLLMSTRDTRTIYLHSQNYGFYRTADGGETWTDLSQGLLEYKGANNILWIDFHPSTERITIATAYGILTSTDGAQTWTPIKTLLPFGSVPIQTVVMNPENSHEIFFTIGNVLQKTVDGGETWKTIKTIPTNRAITNLYLSPATLILYAGTRL